MEVAHETPGLLTVSEAADRCRVSRVTLYRLNSAGELPVVHVGVADRSAYRIRTALEELTEAARTRLGTDRALTR